MPVSSPAVQVPPSQQPPAGLPLAQPGPLPPQQPPVTDSQVAQHVAEILLAGYLASKAAGLIGGVLAAVRPRISPLPDPETIAAVLRMLPLAVVPRSPGLIKGASVLGALPGVSRDTVAALRTTLAHIRRTEAFYRAMYVVNAAKRVQARIADGVTLSRALAAEKVNRDRHHEARSGRMDAARAVVEAALAHGDLLGWYLNPMLRNEPECIAANGHNFKASEGTVLGWPGAVHANCGCRPGPPIPGASMVNDAVAAARRRSAMLGDATRLFQVAS